MFACQNGGAGNFTQSLWARNADRFEQICALPFNRELCNGTLDHDCFRHYIIQDTLYLEEFSRALELAASKALDGSADGDRRCHLLLNLGKGVEDIEDECQDRILAKFGLGNREQVLAKYTPSAACQKYMCFLTATVSEEPLAVAIAAMLTCYWVYREVARWMIAEQRNNLGSPNILDHPYREWLELNACEAYSRQVEEMMALTEELAREADERTRGRMEQMFERAFQMERMFWEAAYQI